MYRKILPTSNSNDEIDQIKQQVDKEIKQIMDESRNYTSHDYRIMNAEKKKPNFRAIKDGEEISEAQEDYQSYEFSEQKSEENVQLSHQIQPKQKFGEIDAESVEQVKSRVKLLTEQLVEFKSLYIKSNDIVKEKEFKISECEEKIQNLEDEIVGMKRVNIRDIKKVNQVGFEKNDGEVQKRNELIRKALLAADHDDEIEVSRSEGLQFDFIDYINRWIVSHFPFKKDIRSIQARFGSSIASYFLFKRFTFIIFCVIGAIVFFFLIIHTISLANRGLTPRQYLVGNGLLPDLMSYSSYKPSESFNYSLMVIMNTAILTIILSYSLVKADKKVKDLNAIDSVHEHIFAKNALCAWDFSVTNKVEVDDLGGRIGNEFLLLLEEDRAKGIKQTRSTYESFQIHFRRVSGFFLYGAVQFGAFTYIIFFTVESQQISNSLQYVSGLENFGSIVAPLALAFINGIMPMIIEMITSLEKWDSGQTIVTVNILRIFISNTLNTLILAFSYYLLIDPLLLAQYPVLRSELQLSVSGSFTCRLDQASSGLFILVLFSWGLKCISLLYTPVYNYFVSIINKKPFIRTEFSVAENTVKELNLLGLIFLSFPFAPLSIVFIPFYYWISFKWEKFCIKKMYLKPKRPWKSHTAELINVFFSLITFLSVGFTTVMYFISTKTLSKSCDLQDNYVGLCTDATLSINNTCTLNTNSKYYRLYSSNYPSQICNYACGPFIDTASAATPFTNAINNNFISNFIWELMFQYPYIPWFLVFVLSISLGFRNNTINVNIITSFYKDRAVEAHVLSIENEKKKQENIIKKLKEIELLNASHDTRDRSVDVHELTDF